MKRAGFQNTNVFYPKKVSIFIFPLIISLIMSAVVGIAVIKTDDPYTVNILIGVMIVLVFWLILFIYNQRKLKIGLSDRYVNGFFAVALSALLVALFFAYSMWGQGYYLSLDPIKRLNNGLQHRDALFFSAIAESYNRSIFPSALVNQETIIRYHTLDCLITNLISRGLLMPCFFVYTYLQPIILLPLYGCLQCVGILEAKKYFVGTGTLKFSDIVVITTYNIGLLAPLHLSHFGIWKSSYVSSSFLTANIFAILFFIFCLHMMRIEKHRNIFSYIGIPITIFILSWSKISVGFLVTMGVLYYFFRTKPKSLKYWLLNLYYLVVFLLSFLLFRPIGGGETGGSQTGFQLFAFIKYCDNSVNGLCGHYLILSLMAILFIIFDIKKKNYKKEDVISGKTIWIELIFIITICSFLPGMLLDVSGGSVVYFSYFSEIPALLLLCGHGYLDTLFDKKKTFLKIGICILFLCRIYILWLDIYRFYLDQKDNTNVVTDINVYEGAMEIRELAAEKPEDFTIYLDADAQVFKVYSDTIAGVYVYPALTGVGVVNASYCKDGIVYTIQDTTFRGYGLANVNHAKLSFDEALQYAQRMGKKKLIRMESDGYEIIELEVQK